MNFRKLYTETRDAARRALKSQWCNGAEGALQENYAAQINDIIDKELFTSESYVPLVQCMDRYKTINDAELESANKLVGGLWKKSFLPYRHQYESWRELMENKRSIVVTTGTGSGKTECFMLPLVHDLIPDAGQGKIRAIFLYPLNALMEDQKQRLQDLLNDTGLRFAVYNGNLPEDKGVSAKSSSLRDKMVRQVEEERKKYPNIVATRQELRSNPPEIILTNPTMLEYMLLRNKDQRLFTQESLRWIVIDEAHTFTGAGAAELSMLIKRVLDAFDMSPDKIRFATSSATIGNSNDSMQKKLATENFIMQLTGASEVRAIDGDRDYKETPSDTEELKRCRKILNLRDYVRLDELFPTKDESIESKLNRLDDLCSLDNPLKAKVHFFVRVPSSGLRVQLDDINADNTFKIKTFVPALNNGAPYLELMRCKSCGEYFAVADSPKSNQNKYKACSNADVDIFSDVQPDGVRKVFFTYSDRTIDPSDKTGTITVDVVGDNVKVNTTTTSGWRLLENIQRRCPCCGQALTSKEADQDDDSYADMQNAFVFRASGQFISKQIAPSILDNLMIPDNVSDEMPHKGQQFISFVDSRQTSAKSTLQQNIEQERLWINSRIYHKLIERASSSDPDRAEKIRKYESLGLSKEEIEKLVGAGPKEYMTWDELFKLLYDDPDADKLAYQFINKREHSEEFDSVNQTVKAIYKAKYVYTAMIEQLGRRPKTKLSAENMGLFISYYPLLEKIERLPKEVEAFIEQFSIKDFDVQQWRNLMKLYLDTVVRTNESIYLKGERWDTIDINDCYDRFGTTKPARRQVEKPHIADDKQGNYRNIIKLLAGLIDSNADDINDVIYNNRAELNKVLDAFWKDLTDTSRVLKQSQYYHDDDKDWKYNVEHKTGERLYRLNVEDIAFRLYDRMCLCDFRSPRSIIAKPRPVDTLFMGYSPYPIGKKLTKPLTEFVDMSIYPYIGGFNGAEKVSTDDIHGWAKNSRSLLWMNGLWNETGEFACMLDSVHQYPDIFIQAEHTAQVDKLIAKETQELFKGKMVNILACSTTMEMGVDLGDLEMVMMTSVPPHPSNYKQRAGRSGRNDYSRSACMTLCNSDSVGLRTLLDPLTNIINRPMATPFVDLNSPQVIQRHANAYLFRLSGIFFDNARGNTNNLDQEIIEFFTPFQFGTNKRGEREYFDIFDVNGDQVYPIDKLGDIGQTRYHQFHDFLNDCDKNPKNRLKSIVRGTIFEGQEAEVIRNCKDEIERCYEELLARVDEIAVAYDYEIANSQSKSRRLDKGYGLHLRHKYSELLSKNIIEFLSTNRFTPNANMPVNIVEFDIHHSQRSGYRGIKVSNPSYPLQQAISQYSPGNTVVLENRTFIARGIQYTGMFRKTVTFKEVYSDGKNTVIGAERRHLLGSLENWSVNGRPELTLIEPYAFIPDINEGYSRTDEPSPYTQVSAQLIGAGQWPDFSKSTSLVAVRNNRDCGDAKILYYNEGVGFGYCFCSNCGKMVLESGVGKSSNMPQDMHDLSKDINGEPFPYHNMINYRKEKRNGGSPVECFSQKKKVLRNVIIGGLIQTDYSEIKIRTQRNIPWINTRMDGNDKLLITLGIVFTQKFVESLGKDRGDVDFAITPDCHLCIFDTNPGGSGYANQFVSSATFNGVMKESLKLLNSITSKDELIDRYTRKYYEKIDVEAAKQWLRDALNASQSLPTEVTNAYPNSNVLVSSFEDILRNFKNSPTASEDMLFVDDNFDKWIYNETNSIDSLQTWRARISQMVTGIGTRKQLMVLHDGGPIPRPIISTLAAINDWANVYSVRMSLPKDIYPIAVVRDKFYFTNQKETVSMNSWWGRGNIFCVDKGKMPKAVVDTIDLTPSPTSVKFTIGLNDPLKINSTDLYGILYSKMGAMFDEFYDHCKSCPDKLEITYQDKYLKSPIAIATTLQLIERIVTKIDKSFKVKFLLEEFVSYESTIIHKDLVNHMSRDEYIDDMMNDMYDNISPIGSHISISNRQGVLPHWRECRFKCGNKELVLYPNGGFINEWYYDALSGAQGLTKDNLQVDTAIPLYRKKPIMYDAELKDC